MLLKEIIDTSGSFTKVIEMNNHGKYKLTLMSSGKTAGIVMQGPYIKSGYPLFALKRTKIDASLADRIFSVIIQKLKQIDVHDFLLDENGNERTHMHYTFNARKLEVNKQITHMLKDIMDDFAE